MPYYCFSDFFVFDHSGSLLEAFHYGSLKDYTCPFCLDILVFILYERAAFVSWQRGGCWKVMLGSGSLSVGAFMYHNYHNFTCTVPFPEDSLWMRCDSTASAVSGDFCT